jgi:Rrf2 family nitric oxide-sensitive transcriptional repressor
VQLTQFSDYSLRILLYLAINPDRVVSVQEISHAYGISSHHLVKIVQLLVRHRLITSVRGRRGGLRLEREPNTITVGELVRITEPHLDLLECFNRDTNTCPIEPVCDLKGEMIRAQQAFLAVLDAHSLADFLHRPIPLVRIWRHTTERVSQEQS